MRDATDAQTSKQGAIKISIHASHAGCDPLLILIAASITYFNPRIPCGMRRSGTIYLEASTDFNPRIPCGMRQKGANMACKTKGISIHASHAGCDQRLGVIKLRISRFQSTHPMRDATAEDAANWIDNNISIHASHAGCDEYTDLEAELEAISIHASHAGCDGGVLCNKCTNRNFNPRIPCGMRRD